MLHEILLALSGHPSPLFYENQDPQATPDHQTPFPALSSTERSLLSSVGTLAEVHNKTRQFCHQISSTHPSLVCRAVATCISTVHLARFQRKILLVEEQILRKDASQVGAYDIVPLAGIIAEFDPWQGLMSWYCMIAEFMLAPKQEPKESCTASSIINRLRRETSTGYFDIEQAALDLRGVAERAWLRQLSSWLLYGNLSKGATYDFFITANTENGETEFHLHTDHLPHFVDEDVAASIHLVGRSLNLIKTRKLMANSSVADISLLPNQASVLSTLQCPLTSSQFSAAIHRIRQTFSQKTLRYLLPLPRILQLLDLMAAFFLLGRGEFAVCLISEADRCMEERRQMSNRSTTTQDTSLKSLMVTEGEISSVLARTWSTLLSMTDDSDASDPIFDLGRKLLSLNMSSNRSQVSTSHHGIKNTHHSFYDMLLSIPVQLTLSIPSPLDLFLTSSDVEKYSSIHAYLLAIRRAHMHLSQLWRQTLLRRDHPAPTGPPRSNTDYGRRVLKQKRERERERRLECRKVWATCSAGVLLLSELGEYFEGQVVQNSWLQFRSWIQRSQPDGENAMSAMRDLSLVSAGSDKHETSMQDTGNAGSRSHDPESVASAHRTFISSLCTSLLITDPAFTGILRSFLANIQALTGSFTRLALIRSALDLESDEGVVDALMDYEHEETTVKLELDRSRKRLDGDMKALLVRLRELDHSTLRTNTEESDGFEVDDPSRRPYQPDQSGGVDQLLMKLDFGALVERNEEDAVYDLL
ncbi:hypothetical protein P152DRAFT_100720 [Eremomyces bilateralis CBS 781.70]|uniref:Spindle pole body component n=1 Tax=Eremomyces bilateralis CBS 781.70 TaxID=1392243 RepID=A0A6G1FXJ0_9PEZI|nr:uncharacterized protein P152DRAFT_100720 [Eremomyces bilateralis CBS 781.70]KAF1810503.1 hypothetical protein P152DRAFT_100720 [Eremomyces bilateralis CBS 781.70]